MTPRTKSPFDQADVEPWVRKLPPDEYWSEVVAAGYRALEKERQCALCPGKSAGFDLFFYLPDFAQRIGQREGGGVLSFLCRECLRLPDVDARIERDLLRRYREWGEDNDTITNIRGVTDDSNIEF